MRTIAGVFHRSMADVFPSVYSILIPNLLNLLCNTYLMVLFHISVFNWCVLNSCHLEHIFYYHIIKQLHRFLSVNHTSHTFIYFNPKKGLMIIVTECCIYFQHIHLMLLQFLFCGFLWILNPWKLNNLSSFL